MPASTAGDAGTGLLAPPVSILDCSWHLSGYRNLGGLHQTESLTPFVAHPSCLAQLSPASPFLSAPLPWGRRHLAGFLSTSRPLRSCPLAPWKPSSVWGSPCFVELLTLRTLGTCRQSEGPLLSRAGNGLPDPDGDQGTWGRLRAAVCLDYHKVFHGIAYCLRVWGEGERHSAVRAAATVAGVFITLCAPCSGLEEHYPIQSSHQSYEVVTTTVWFYTCGDFEKFSKFVWGQEVENVGLPLRPAWFLSCMLCHLG